jgi:YD repeat-containing protein
MSKKLFPIAIFFCICICNKASGQSFDQYLKTLNSFVAVAPESAQIMKAVDFPVNLFTGTTNVDIPIYTLRGIDIAVPVSLRYNAGGGVRVDEISSENGLGWALAAGGEITREVRGTPDEGGGSGFAIGYFNNPHKLSYYVANKINTTNTQIEEEYAARGKFDLEPDIFYFSFGNKSGKFFYNDDKGKFECVIQAPLKIDFSGNSTTSRFNITDDDGTKYVFANQVTATSKSECVGVATNGSFPPVVTTSWKITKIINANQTDSIMFAYTIGEYYYYSSGSSTKYQVQTGPGTTPPRKNLECFNYNKFSGSLNIAKIYSGVDSVVFERQTTQREDLPNAFAISRIKTFNKDGSLKNIFGFDYSYFSRPNFVGVIPATNYNNKSLKLLSLTDFGNSETNANPLRWVFDYRSEVLPGRLSYAQDYWGLANSNSTNTLVPAQLLLTDFGANFMPGADRSPDTSKMKAGLLQKITYPTGGTTEFTYESNTTAKAIPFISGATTTVQYAVSAFKGVDSPFSTSVDSYKVNFTINQPPNPIINLNNPDGGVIADIHVEPAIGPIVQPGAYEPSKIHFILSGPSGVILTNQLNGVHLKNGNYQLRIGSIAYMNQAERIGNIRSISFYVTYRIMDSTVNVHNYNCGGVRIKQITEKDPYSGTQNIRQFLYHNPVTDSSYGEVISPMHNFYQDYSHEQLVTGGGLYDVWSQYLVRMGNCVIPGNNPSGAPVIYPKVIEQKVSGSQVYRTEHYFSVQHPIYNQGWPYSPPLVDESIQGKQLKSINLRQTGLNNFVPAKSQTNKYVINISPPSNPILGFNTWLNAIRSSPGGFSNTSTAVGEYIIPAVTQVYQVASTRAYLEADSTVEYDANGVPALIKWNNYTYGDYNQLPLKISRGNSKGDTWVEKYGYAIDAAESDLAPSSSFAAALTTNNRVSEALGYKFYKNANLLERGFKYGHVTGKQLLIDSLSQAEYNNPLERYIRILDYDNWANPLTLEEPGSLFRKYIWCKERDLALATCTMPVKSHFVFTSFEYPGEYSTILENGRTTSYNFSGKYAYYLNGSLIFQGFNAPAGLEVYAWTTQGNFAANGIAAVSTGRTKGVWTLYKASIPNYATVTIAGLLVLDQLIIVPVGSSFDGSVYDEVDRISAKVNQNMQTSFYEYDVFGRLITVRNEDGNIIKSNSYQYQVTQ